jgi:Dolichyl-phosphate-mannose-protein mannosyltransferase
MRAKAKENFVKADKDILYPNLATRNQEVNNDTAAQQCLSEGRMDDKTTPILQETLKPLHDAKPAKTQRNKRLTSGVLAVLMVSGLALRLWNLGYLNFWGDENITALAVRGIIDHGYPKFPSGMIYFRSLPTTYLSALFAMLFGEEKFALRLPSVLFSVATLFLIYKLGQRIFSTTVGVAAAFVLTFSYWDLEFARHARMYVPFAFFYCFSLYAIYRGVLENDRKWFWLSLPIAIGTVLVHELGGAVALLYITLAVRPQVHKFSRIHLLGVAAFLILLAGIQFSVVQFGFTIPIHLYEDTAGQTSLPMSTIQQIENLFQFPLVQSPLLSWPALLLAGLAILLLGWFFIPKRYPGQFWTRLTLVSVIVVLAIHQILLAGLILVFYLLFSEKGFHGFARREVWVMVILILLALGFWTTYGLYDWTDSATPFAHRLIEVIKIEAGLPKLYYLCFFASFPLMATVVVAGLLRLFHQSSQPYRKASDHKVKAFFIFTGFVIPLLATGFLKTDWMEYRLNFHLNPLFVLIYVFAFAELLQAAQQWLARRGLGQSWRVATPIVIGLALLGCGEQIYPQRVYHLVTRDYGDPVDSHSAPGSHFRLMPDHQLPGDYVKRQRLESDIVIAMDWLAQHNYAGRIDYWLRTDAYKLQAYHRGQNYFDIYTGTQIVATVEDLQKIIAERAARRIWIITASAYTESQLHVTNEMLNFLNSLNQYIVLTGRDEKSLVYLLPAQPQ